jgi:alanine racemase/tRNA threonylcarbamoyladenosine biosynthesis protein TsaE
VTSRTVAAASVLDLVIDLDHDVDEPRTLTLTGRGPRWERLADVCLG